MTFAQRQASCQAAGGRAGPDRVVGTRATALALALLTLLATEGSARAGAFIFAGDVWGVDVVTHPLGYTGGGGNLNVSVCIDPAMTDAALMVIPVQNAIRTWNERIPTTGNLFSDEHNAIPWSMMFVFDIESTLVHEIGHCVGLHHVNLATESGVARADRDYTKTTTGGNAVFNLASGADAIRGSRDDVRGDDINLHWFNATNDPFTLVAPVETTSYFRNTALLPGLDLFAANGDRDVAEALLHVNTEVVMQQGQPDDEEQRRLVHDDVATLLYAMSGIDETAGTADDYNLVLNYLGLTTGCQVVIETDNALGFAGCTAGTTSIGGDHRSVSSAAIGFNDTINWYFNPTLTSTSTADLDLVVSDDVDPVGAGGTLTYSFDVFNSGPNNAAAAVLTVILPWAVTFVTDNGFGCNTSALPVVTCSQGVPAGSGGVVDLTVTAPNFATDLSVTATLRSGEFDPDLSNNTRVEQTTVDPLIITFGGIVSYLGTPLFVPGPLISGVHINGFGTSDPIIFGTSYVGTPLQDLPAAPSSPLSYVGTQLDMGLGVSGAVAGAGWTTNGSGDFELLVPRSWIGLAQTDLDPPGSNNGTADLKITLHVPFVSSLSGTRTFNASFDIRSSKAVLGASDFVRAEMCVYENVGDMLTVADPISCLLPPKNGSYTLLTNIGSGAPLPHAALSNMPVTVVGGTSYVAIATWEIAVKNQSGPVDLNLAHFEFGIGNPDCGNGSLQTGEACDDGSTISLDGCSATCELEDIWGFGGTAVGGYTIEFTVDGVALQIITVAGQTATDIAQAVAAAINGDATLQSNGVNAFSSGSEMAVDAALTDAVVNDPGLTQTPPVYVPALSLPGLILVFAVLSGTGYVWWRRLRLGERA